MRLIDSIAIGMIVTVGMAILLLLNLLRPSDDAVWFITFGWIAITIILWGTEVTIEMIVCHFIAYMIGVLLFGPFVVKTIVDLRSLLL